MFDPVQGGIEGALLNLQLVARHLLDAQEDAVSVQRSERNGLEDQQVQRALQQFGGTGHGVSPRITKGEATASLLGCQGEDADRRLGRWSISFTMQSYRDYNVSMRLRPLHVKLILPALTEATSPFWR